MDSMLQATAIRAPRILAGLVCAALLAGCGGSGASPQGSAPEVRATFDTDMAATEALRTELQRTYGMAPDLAQLEAALSADGYFCGPDPSKPSETACLREQPRGACMEASLIRTRPWRPDQAQVVVICEPGQSPEAEPQP